MRTLQIAIITSVVIFGVLASTDNAFATTFIDSLDTSAIGGGQAAVEFSNSGTKMYIISENTDSIYEYNCTTSWDASTCTLDTTTVIDPAMILPSAITWNPTGTTMFVSDRQTDFIYEFDCVNNPFEVENCSYDGDLERLATIQNQVQGIKFSTNGLKFFTVGTDSDNVDEYTCLTAFDVSTCSYDGADERLDVSGEDTQPYDIEFNLDGTKLFVLGLSNLDISEYSCSVGFDVSTCTYSGDDDSFSLAGEMTVPISMAFGGVGENLLVLDLSLQGVFHYSVDPAFDITVTSSPTPASTTESGGGGNDRAKSAPTSGDDWNTHNLIVENGITANGISYDITDNWHTDFELLKVKTGTSNKFITKTWSQNGGLMLHEIAFGIPQVGSYDKAEAMIEVWYNHDKSIDKVVVVQKTEVINVEYLRVSTDQVKCREDAMAQCYQTTFDVMFKEPLKDDIFAIKSVDMTRRSMSPTYLNDGLDVFGRTFTFMKTMTIPGPEKYEGLITITQTEKYSDIWQSDDGRVFEMFGDSDSVRLLPQEMAREIDNTKFSERSDSGFENYKNLINERYILIFDASELEKQIPESFAYEYPDVDSRTQFLIDTGLIDYIRK